jgi:hypothetical protein
MFSSQNVIYDLAWDSKEALLGAPKKLLVRGDCISTTTARLCQKINQLEILSKAK